MLRNSSPLARYLRLPPLLRVLEPHIALSKGTGEVYSAKRRSSIPLWKTVREGNEIHKTCCVDISSIGCAGWSGLSFLTCSGYFPRTGNAAMVFRVLQCCSLCLSFTTNFRLGEFIIINLSQIMHLTSSRSLLFWVSFYERGLCDYVSKIPSNPVVLTPMWGTTNH